MNPHRFVMRLNKNTLVQWDFNYRLGAGGYAHGATLRGELNKAATAEMELNRTLRFKSSLEKSVL